HHHQHPQHYQDWLYAANGTQIWTYSQAQLNLNLGLRRAFAFNFHIADTQNNIIGADFLAQYHFCPNLQARRLLDADTLLSRPLKLRNCNQPSLSAINSSLDGRVQELLKLKATTTAADSPVEHHILTTEGLPIFCRPRRFIGGKNGKRTTKMEDKELTEKLMNDEVKSETANEASIGTSLSISNVVDIILQKLMSAASGTEDPSNLSSMRSLAMLAKLRLWGQVWKNSVEHYCRRHMKSLTIKVDLSHKGDRKVIEQGKP
ncbi:hypothetical protein TYRP_022568, partial [Tyrophagus putrescentiae]